jgi:hypothetical protein
MKLQGSGGSRRRQGNTALRAENGMNVYPTKAVSPLAATKVSKSPRSVYSCSEKSYSKTTFWKHGTHQTHGIEDHKARLLFRVFRVFRG